MIIRQALNFTAHLVAGIAVGALAVTTYKALKRRDREDWIDAAGPEDGNESVESRSGATR